MGEVHTSGPWEVCPDDPTQVRDGEGGLVADCRRFTYTDNGEVDCPDNEANARLIAAAPDLLVEHDVRASDLVMLRKAIEAGDPKAELLIRIDDMLRETRAAIAKATGK